MRSALVLCLLPIALSADPSMECSDAGSQVEIGACVSEMAERVDAALATALSIAQGAAAELDQVTEREVMSPALEASQSAWSAYRDAHCDAIGASFGGGSGTGIAITSCRLELGRARVDALLDMAR